MKTQSEHKPRWTQRWCERRQLGRELTGDSPEKLAERHIPTRDWVDRWLWSGGIERPNRFA